MNEIYTNITILVKDSIVIVKMETAKFITLEKDQREKFLCKSCINYDSVREKV